MMCFILPINPIGLLLEGLFKHVGGYRLWAVLADAGVVFVFVPDDWPDTIPPVGGEMLLKPRGRFSFRGTVAIHF